jgi:hypothetical protein
MPRTPSHILELAKRGAEQRYHELQAEISALERVFSHLRYGAAVSPAMPDAVEEGSLPPSGKGRRRMSAAARKAASARMRRYWAAKRKAKARGRRKRPSRT